MTLVANRPAITPAQMIVTAWAASIALGNAIEGAPQAAIIPKPGFVSCAGTNLPRDGLCLTL